MPDVTFAASTADLQQQITDLRREVDTGRRYKLLAEGLPQLIWMSSDTGQWRWASPQWESFTGQSDDQSRDTGWQDALHPDDRAVANEAWATAKVKQQYEADFRVRRASDGAYIWHQTRALPLGDDGTRPCEWAGTTTDVEDLKEAQERQSVMVAELQHRTRNLIAVVKSVAEKTVRGAASLDGFAIDFGTRLAALGRVQGLLSRSSANQQVTFGDLIRGELSAHEVPNSDRIVLEGPDDVALPGRAVQTLALALHELATNAIKYGALSQPTGRLTVRWWLVPGDAGRLYVEWLESGMASLLAVPTRRGYGRELIERALPYQLGAQTNYTIGRHGVHCTIVIPVA